MAEMRKCVGSARFGIEPHLAPIEDFPKQPSQKDGLGRICTTHWNQYTAGLARDAKARKAALTVTAETEPGTAEASVTNPAVTAEAAPSEPAPKRPRRAKAAITANDGQEVAG